MKNKSQNTLENDGPSINLRSLSEEIVKEINLARCFPEKYLEKVKLLRENINEKFNMVIVNNKQQLFLNNIQTLFDDLIIYLSKMKSVIKLQCNEILSNCSEEFAKNTKSFHLNEKNLMKNTIDFEKRLRKNGILNGLFAECIDYGLCDAESIVLKLLLDEDNDKVERNILFNNSLKYIGVSCANLSPEITISVLNMSENLTNKKDKLTVKNNRKITDERLGKKLDSLNDFKYKIQLYNTCINNRNSFENSSMNTSISTKQTSFASHKNNQEEISSNKSSRNLIFQMNSNTRSKINGTTAVSNLKDLKISPEGLDKAPNLLKRLISHSPYHSVNLAKVKLGAEKKEEIPVNSNYLRFSTIPVKMKVEEERNNLNTINISEISKEQHIVSSSIDTSNVNLEEVVSETNLLKNLQYYNKIEKKPSTKIKETLNNSTYQKTNMNDNVKETTKNKNTSRKINNYIKNEKDNFEIEIIDNKNIRCLNVNKKKIVEKNGRESYIIKKTVYYNNGSTDEWVFKEKI